MEEFASVVEWYTLWGKLAASKLAYAVFIKSLLILTYIYLIY